MTPPLSIGRGCTDCLYCLGNGVNQHGYACMDCEGSGCQRHPFCDVDHDAEWIAANCDSVTLAGQEQKP